MKVKDSNIMFVHPDVSIFYSISTKQHNDLILLNKDIDINPCRYIVVDKKFDIWSIGIIAFILFYQKVPFEGSIKNTLL